MPRRAKAVRRPRLRADAERGPLSLREIIRQRFQVAEMLVWACLSPANFFQELPTEAERRAFSEEFPEHIYELFNFFSHATDALPASTMYAFQGIFRRPAEEFMSMIQEHPPRLAFDPPDVSRLHFYPEQFEAMAVARGAWWKANGLPMSSKERAWLAEHDEKEN